MRRLSNLVVKLRITGFVRNKAGMAAVEFAYLAPLLMLITFGTFEMTRALIVHKRFQRATAMIGDLIAREAELGTTAANARATLDGMMLSAQHTMEPYSFTPLSMDVYQIWASISDASKTKIEWSYHYKYPSPTAASDDCGNLKSMPASGMLPTNGRAIVVEAKYKYTPLLTNIIPGLVHQMDWSDTMAFLPREGVVAFIKGLNNTDWQNPSNAPCQ
jgi:Flp pilus assembly protein TadG